MYASGESPASHHLPARSDRYPKLLVPVVTVAGECSRASAADAALRNTQESAAGAALRNTQEEMELSLAYCVRRIAYSPLMLSPHADGVIVTVWVVPGASRDQVVGEHGGALKVRTVAPAEGGQANSRVAAMVAEAVGGRSGSLVGGYASRRKQVLVIGVKAAEAAAALTGDVQRREQTE